MNKFILKGIVFLMLIIIIGSIMEFMLRQIPNDYRHKKNYLELNSDFIEVLFLGSSHSFYGLNPSYTKKRSYNASHVSQTLNYDLAILNKYEKNWLNLRYIVLPISFFSLFEKLETSEGAWRIKNYCIYYKIKSSGCLRYCSEISSVQLRTNLSRLYSYYFKNIDNISCTELGWGSLYNSKKSLDLIKTGKAAAARHMKINDQHFGEMTLVLDAIINFAEKHEIRLILFTPPSYKSYIESLNQTRMNKTILTIRNLLKMYDNCKYYNLLEDTSFFDRDFYDADHLNEIGAKKLTLKIDSIINSM